MTEKRRGSPRRPRKSVVPSPEELRSFADSAEEPRRSRNPAREIPVEDRHVVDPLPEPATEDQLLVAVAKLDPLSQEVMLAQRLAVMPHPSRPDEAMPVPIDRRCRAPWAHHLRSLGIFCVPELATHELVGDPGGGVTLRSIDRSDLWRVAKEHSPELGSLVEGAETPEQKREAMKILAARLPVQQRLALEKLLAASPEDLEV